MVEAIHALDARSRIVETAYRLFYEQGYQATGINQVIEESGVAKATFYHHFPAKDDLGLVYVQERLRRELAETEELVAACQGAREQFLAPMAILVHWLEATGYRGCPFQNIIHEFPDPKHPVHGEVERGKAKFLDLFRRLTRNLIQSSSLYRFLNEEEVARTYMLLFEGAVIMAVIQRKTGPIQDGLKSLIRLIEPKQ